MDNTANGVNFELRKIIRIHVKSRNESHLGVWIFGVPVASNLDCIFFAEHRVEDWLFRKPRRERITIGIAD